MVFSFGNSPKGIEPIAEQQSGGLLQPPVQTLAATYIFFSPEKKMQIDSRTLLQTARVLFAFGHFAVLGSVSTENGDRKSHILLKEYRIALAYSPNDVI
jgi:hypothetical protein